MLLLMRKRIGTFVVRIFAVLLILGFGAWGIQDMLDYRVGGGGAIAEVGESRLDPNQLYREVNQEIARLRPMFGNRLDMEMARRLGLVDAVLNRQIDSLATSESATKLGVVVSDELVRSVIVAEPTFKGLAGGFDRDRFQQVLQATGISEAAYVEDVRQSVASQQVLASLAAGATAPNAWVEAVYRYREETRTAESVFVADKDSGSGAEPTAEQLQKFYDANKQTFTAPEYRAVRFVRLDAVELAKEVEVGEDALKEAFARRADEFVTLERRTVRQIIIPDEAKAKAAAKRLAEGADFLTVAKEDAGQEAATVELGEIVKGDLLGELADPVFAAKAGSVTEAIKSPLGWHIFQIVSVKAGGTQTFEQVSEKLKKDIAHEKALDGLYGLSNKFEDALGGGATIEEAAKQLNLKVEKVGAIDAEGLDRAGKAVEGLPAGPGFPALAFSTEEGADSAMTEAGESGFYILHVDKVTKPALRPFDEVKAKVADGWKAEERRKSAESRAKAIVDAVNGGKALADVLATTPLKAEVSTPLRRDGRGAGSAFDGKLVGQLFNVAPGKAVMGRIGDGFRVAVLKDVKAADPAADKKGVEELDAALSQSLQGDVVRGLQVAYRNEVGVKVYRETMEQLFGKKQQ